MRSSGLVFSSFAMQVFEDDFDGKMPFQKKAVSQTKKEEAHG